MPSGHQSLVPYLVLFIIGLIFRVATALPLSLYLSAQFVSWGCVG